MSRKLLAIKIIILTKLSNIYVQLGEMFLVVFKIKFSFTLEWRFKADCGLEIFIQYPKVRWFCINTRMALIKYSWTFVLLIRKKIVIITARRLTSDECGQAKIPILNKNSFFDKWKKNILMISSAYIIFSYSLWLQFQIRR